MTRTTSPARRYARDLTLSLLGYAVLLITAIVLLPLLPGRWGWVIMLIPVPALIGVGWAVLRWVRASDELQSKITVESLAIGFGLGSLITFSYGLLQVAGAPTLSWLFVWPVYAACWIIGRFVAGRHY